MHEKIISLYNNHRLIELDHEFLTYLQKCDEDLYIQLLQARVLGVGDSNLIIELSHVVEKFVAEFFALDDQLQSLKQKCDDFASLYKCKRSFVQRHALKKYPDIAALDQNNFKAYLEETFDEGKFVKQTMFWLENQTEYQHELEIAAQYAAWMVHTHSSDNIVFQTPIKIDLQNPAGNLHYHNPTLPQKVRQGFELTCIKPTSEQALDQANYCIFCHKRNKDSCSIGMQNTDRTFQHSPLGVQLHGCPLRQKISEMNIVKSHGGVISALAIVMIDNPLCVLTGYKICNDCSKACIYQKQTPVNIPMIETRVLDDVLNLPYGFEIYSLLTRWNPLHFARPLPRSNTNKNVLVVGLGPAGINLAHHLLNDGHNVVAIDGLKIEPIEAKISGIEPDKTRVPFKPIYNLQKELSEKLSERISWGFGGVSEYGITVRWDKNYLKVARLVLERRQNFMMFGGIRLGSNITIDNAFKLGFDHIALALGSGKPNLLDIPNSLARGARTASDFLMSLQLSGAAKNDSIANLQLRLPIIVIGGGLTAVDTATEALAYYPVQVEKFLCRYEILLKTFGREQVESTWDEEDKIIAAEFIDHALELRQTLDKITFLQNLGGVKIIYRKTLLESPSYRLNSDELHAAMAEGVEFIENLTPLELLVDQFKHVSGIKFANKNNNSEVLIKARSVLFAIGTEANDVITREEEKYLQSAKNLFKLTNKEININDSIFLYNQKISFFGDINPEYRGSVVKAMASSKNGYPLITKSLGRTLDARPNFFAHLSQQLQTQVLKVERIGKKIIEVVVKSPLAAQNFQPGQFFRLQNFEVNSKELTLSEIKTKFAAEGLALTGSSVDKERGLISLIVLEMGGSSDVCAHLSPGEYVSLMGPTGTPTEIPENEGVLLIGGGLGNAVLFSIGEAMLQKNCRVLYIAGYKNSDDVFKMSAIEKAANWVVWACESEKITARRPQDYSFQGNVISALVNYQQKCGDLAKIDRIIAIGSEGMMNAVNVARNTVLKPYLKKSHKAFASINSPMQCMMKEICAQCLQKHIDPVTHQETFVYSCAIQDQNMVTVDFDYLHERLKQNSLQEKLTAQWINLHREALKSTN